MNSIEIIVEALWIALTRESKLSAEEKALYSDMKKHIQENYQRAYLSLEALEKEPNIQSRQDSLYEELLTSHAEEDASLLEQAQKLLQMSMFDVELRKTTSHRLKYDPNRFKCYSLSDHKHRITMTSAHVSISGNTVPSDERKGLYPVWFGTTRKPIDQNDLTRGFSHQRDDHVYYGKCDVFIPKGHHFGEIGRPWYKRWIRGDFEDDNLKLRRIIPYNDANNFWLGLQKEFSEHEGDALIFLHGYNNSFEDAAIRAAQIGFDLKISGATAFFSWPSKGEVSGYPYDVASIEGSEIAITDFLLDFTQKSGASKVHLIAHSMGNRGLLRALERIQCKLKEHSKVSFGQIILAAPDLDVQLFRNLACLYSELSERTTLYTSPEDKAVELSEWLHDYPRVGIVPPITVIDGIDTIEVNIDKFNLFELGHSYFAEAEGILHDIFDLLCYNRSPSNRQGLIEKQTERGNKYWLIR